MANVRGGVSGILNECRAELMKAPNCMFASDNTGGVCPEVMEAVRQVNELPAMPSYGECPVTTKTIEVMKKELSLDDAAHIRFVSNGTGGNVLALSLACSRPFHSVVTSKCAHVQTNTVGACENVFGAKMHLLPSPKVVPAELDTLLAHCNETPEFYTLPRVVSITLSTEFGDIYDLNEITAIKEVCSRYNVLLHVDGARIANACVSMMMRGSEGLKPSEIMRRVIALADLVTLGGAKNGLFNAEAVVIKGHVCPSAVEVKAASKQQLLIMSKARYASVQYLAYFTDALWERNASSANGMASFMYETLLAKPSVVHVEVPQTNQLFITVTEEQLKTLQNKYLLYPWGEREGRVVVRVVTSWETGEEGCRKFTDLF